MASNGTKISYTGAVISKQPGRGDGLKLRVPKGSYILPADFVAALGQGNSIAGHMKIKEMYGRKGSELFHNVPSNTINISGGEDVLSPLEVERSGGPEKLDSSVNQVRSTWIQQLQSQHGPQKGTKSFDDGGDDSGDDSGSSDSSGTDDGGESASDGIDAEGNSVDANQDGVNDVTGDPIGPDNAFDANAQATDMMQAADALYADMYGYPDIQSPMAPDVNNWDPQSINSYVDPTNVGPPDYTNPNAIETRGENGLVWDPDFYNPDNPVGVAPQEPDVTTGNPGTNTGTTPDVSGPGVSTSPGTGTSPGVDTSNPGVDTTGPVDVGEFTTGGGGGTRPGWGNFFKGGYIDYTVKTKGGKKEKNVIDRPKKKKRNGLKINSSSSMSDGDGDD